jgi:hypothetical protein
MFNNNLSIDYHNKNQMELFVNDGLTTCSSYIINNNTLTCKILSILCMCCEPAQYNIKEFNENSLDELLEIIPENIKEEIKNNYIYLKRSKNSIKYKLYGIDILERITGVNFDDEVCENGKCNWHGKKKDKLDKCPNEYISCPIFNNECKPIKRKYFNDHKLHKCHLCNFSSHDQYIFKNHIYNCPNGNYRCNDCYFIGKLNLLPYHDCVLNGSKTNYKRVNQFGNKIII